jgi:hypothetical protein
MLDSLKDLGLEKNASRARLRAVARALMTARYIPTEPDQISGEEFKTKPSHQLSVRTNRFFMSSDRAKGGACGNACGLRACELYLINLPERRNMAPR